MLDLIDRYWLHVICLLLLVKNAFGLKNALRFRQAFKTKAVICCPALIIAAHGTVNGGYFTRAHAKAAYLVEWQEIHGRMICSCDHRIDKGDKVQIFIPQDHPERFAFSEQQVKNAVLTYGVWTAVFSVFACFLLIGGLFIQ